MAEAALAPQPWMTAEATVAVMAALEAAGGAGCARFVGGCVRNSLTGHPVKDVDIATVLTPDRVMAALKAAKLKSIPTGVDHGTVTAISDGRPFEITTLRRDVETDGRRAVVAFTTDWAEDAQRRDFRLNALYADAQGRLFDPTGEGVADARAGRIAFVGDAETRIREDALRILRFFRFQAWYGRGEPDTVSLDACVRLKALLLGLSAERVSKEVLELLAADDPRAIVRLMADRGMLAVILPEADDLERFARLVAIETGPLSRCDPVLRLAALLPDDPAVGVATAKRLRLSNAQRDRLEAALRVDPAPTSAMSPREARKALYRLGRAAFEDRLVLAWARTTGEDDRWRGLFSVAEAWTKPFFALTGDEALAAGAAPGPMVGRVLREVEDWWIDRDFPDDRPALVERLKAAIQGAGI